MMTRTTATLLFTASALAMGTHSAQAAEVLFSSSGEARALIGERITQTSGVTQIKLDNGATLSFVDGAEYQINADGTVELFSGSVTVAGGPEMATIVRMPDGAQGSVAGIGSAAAFSVNEDGESFGHAITGTAMVTRGRNEREFRAGEFWASAGRRGLRQIVARNEAAPTPDGSSAGERTFAEQPVEVADMSEGGPVAAAQNGLPVSLGDALAAAGASSDILAAARNVDLAAGNPSLDTFPTGDLSLLVAAAAELEGFNGGTPFPAAQADIIRTYLGFLADGGSGANFLSSYAGFLGAYLDLIRSGGLPSNFGATSLADINAFLAYSGRTGAIDALAAADRALAQRYLAFLANGGNVDGFSATFTSLVNAYFVFVRGGGDPENFAGASQAVLDDYIAFLAASGLEQQLSDPDQTLVAAYNAFGGLGFARAFQSELDAYFTFLQGGNRPSDFSENDLATLQDYLEQLDAAGLLGEFLGQQAGFFANYLAFVQGGGDPDAFAGLNATIFSGYAADLDAYYTYLLNGGAPSAYAPLTQAQIAQYVAALQAQGVTARFLDDLAGFYSDYAAFLASGGNPDVFTGLPVLNLPAFADALNAYAAFLNNGGLPAAFTATDLTTLANYVSALEAAGETGNLLGANADLVRAYFAFFADGGAVNLFPGLPLYAGYVDALQDYFAFLDNGGLPADFTALTPQQIQSYLAALAQAGGLASQLGNLSDFYSSYFAFIAAGGNPAQFSGLPVYATYAADLQAYFTFLAGGGLPADFTGLTQAQIANYLAALKAAGGFQVQIGGDAAAFFADYFAFIGAGNDPATFAQLPVYGNYVTALNAYFDFLAGGGLPADFTGLSQQLIAQYIAALNGVVGGLDAFDNLDMFADDYAAFILGGGDPARFAGLPVYASYVTQLNQYFAFLAGGGLPGDFTGLDAATIEAYLAALANVTGGLGAFANLNGNFDSYITFLLGGGDPASFAGLPVYNSYVTQLNAYFAFLAGGGLPADYTALDQATIEAYLAALTNVTGGLDSFTGLNSFFAAYAQFVLGGGDPGEFAGLPIYAEYLTAISEFYAFLLGGGVPSGFTGLTAQQIEDYLAALQAAGLLADTFDGEVLTFFNDYLAFLASGGVPDNFGDLPGALEGMFNNAIVAAVSRNGFSNGAQSLAEIENDGQITALQVGAGPRIDYAASGDTLRERGRIGDIVAWTRYERGASTGGVSNFNTHLLAGAPATNRPASGLVNYNLIGGTAPTDAYGEAGSIGFLSGEVAVAYGATARIGMELDIYAGTRGWNASTNGGAANAASGGIAIADDSSFSLGLQTVSILGDGCAEGCGTTLTGGLFGEGASHLGFTYFLQDSPGSAGQSLVNGTAIFGVGGTALDGIGTLPVIAPPVTGTPLILANQVAFGATTGIKYNLAGPNVGLSGFSADSVVSNADRGIISIVEDFRPRSIGTASATDISTNARFAIGRWTDGEYISIVQSEDTALTNTQGVHYLFAGPTMGGFAIPTTGRIDYELIAATAPTIADGSLAPGKFEADMAILFGSTRRVAIEGTITMPTSGADYVYNFATEGGIADPSQSTRDFSVIKGRNVNFSILGDGITTSDNACDINCTIQFAGYFAGADINQLGLTYSALTTVDATVNDKRINGAAIFGNGVYDDGISTDPFGPGGPTLAYTGGFTTAGTGLFARSASFNSFSSPGTPPNVVSVATQGTALEAVLDSNGGLERYRTRVGTIYDVYDRGTAQQFDVSGNADVLIGRWSNGSYVSKASAGAQPSNQALTANQGFHYFLSDGFTGPSAFPTGRVEYELLAATRPTIIDGTLAPGTFSADAAIIYGAAPSLAIEGQIAFEGLTYSFATSGGVAGAGAPITISNQASSTPGGYFNFSAPGQTDDGRSGPINFEARMSDAQGSSFGTAYTANFSNVATGQNFNAAIGAAIFGAQAPAGGGGGTDPLVTTYLGGFPSGTGRAFSTDGGNSQPGSESATLADSGALVSAGNLAAGTATAFDVAGDESAVIGRFSDGTATFLGSSSNYSANDGLPYVVLAPSVNALPTSGQIDYVVFAATDPVFNNGESAPGKFNGELSIQFGSTLRYQTNGTIVMPEASGDVTYAFASQGFNTGAFQNMNIAGPGPADYFFTGDVTGSGRGCTGSNCNITFYGGFGGENPEERAGFVYQVFGGSFSAPRIQGSVIYAPEGTVPGASTGGGGTGSGFTGTRDGIVYYTYTGGSLASGFGGSADLLDGALTKFTSALGTVTIGSAEAVEAGDVGTLAWARWTNGTVESSGVFNSDTPLVASDGYHVMAGAASTSLPGSGTINYELIGTTSATDKFGAAPGTMSGDLAIAFGSTSKVGFDLAMNFGARGYGVSSTGGAASPGSSEFNIVAGSGGPNFSAAFNSILGNVTGTGGACAASCQVSVSGALYGPNASHVGVAMNVFDAGSGTAVQASGLAIFGAPGAAGTAGSGGGLTTAAAIAPTAQSADWDRWEVSGDAPVTAALGTGVAPGMAPGIDALQASGIQFNAEQLQRLEAHLAAQMR